MATCAGAPAAHYERVREMQAALFAEDVVPPDEAITWTDAELEAFFETGGGMDGRNIRLNKILGKLRAAADHWPYDIEQPSATDTSALDTGGLWGASSRGVEVRPCVERPNKGMGVFATRPLAAGACVGVYAGELLSVGAYNRRHVSRRCCTASDPERVRRLRSLRPGRAPLGGPNNGGSYVVCLASRMLVDLAAGEEPERVALYIDAEDPDRSSWTRYVNHAETADSCCNLKLQTAAAPVACAWLVASREIEPGEELHFDCVSRTARSLRSPTDRASCWFRVVSGSCRFALPCGGGRRTVLLASTQ